MDKEDSDNPYRPLKIIDDSYVRTIIKRINSVEKKLDGKAIIEEMFQLKTLGELIDWIEEKKPQIVAPKIINCTKSLVFIVGNLDEAFKVGGDLNPDFDADIFYDETSKVTINDIKTSLKDRFRAEYYQLKIRMNSLETMLDKLTKGELDFKPKCPIGLLQQQLDTMRQYFGILQIRASIEDIDLGDGTITGTPKDNE
jgi:hypothetical protein